ncbi:MAG: endolytic transglycosylase MltG [Saprospiraceae bacterium]
MSNKYKIIAAILGILIIFGYLKIDALVWKSNVNVPAEGKAIFIPTNASFEDVVQLLKDSTILKDEGSFRMLAGLMSYNKESVPAGKYIIKEDMSNRALISKLRSGNQNPQQVVINNIRLKSDLAGKAARYLEQDSLSFLKYLTDPTTSEKYGYNQDNFLTMFIPNTYEMFWTTTPEKFVSRMKKEYDTFWNEERLAKLKERNLTQSEAYIVASIVEKESNYDPERPTIAGVYLNRLKIGDKLRADPTVVFAMGDFGLQRVLFSHLETDSPYNTYMHAGLPPGPICMPSAKSLEAVINSEEHEYMFFCAKADNSGIHVFAKEYSDHLKNAAAFSAWMNSLNIK